MAASVSRGVPRGIMSKFAFISASILATSVLNLSAQVKVATPSSIRVHHFVEKEGKVATKILSDLAEKYRLVIGVYGSGNYRLVEMPKGIDVEIKDGTLADVFDAIADIHRHSVSTHQTIGSMTDQQFEWHQDTNGGVHFALQGAPFSLMDVTVHSFDYENPQWPEITDRLRSIPEVSDWLRDHKCSLPPEEIYIAGQPPKPWRKFSVHARNLPLSSILDQIAAESNTYYWHAAQLTEPDRCDVTIQWWL
jgi:hypothetical protein